VRPRFLIQQSRTGENTFWLLICLVVLFILLICFRPWREASNPKGRGGEALPRGSLQPPRTHRLEPCESASVGLGATLAAATCFGFFFSVGIVLQTFAKLPFLQTTLVCRERKVLPARFPWRPGRSSLNIVYRTQNRPVRIPAGG